MSNERKHIDYGERPKGAADKGVAGPRVNQSHEKDVLDNFMSLPKQQ